MKKQVEKGLSEQEKDFLYFFLMKIWMILLIDGITETVKHETKKTRNKKVDSVYFATTF